MTQPSVAAFAAVCSLWLATFAAALQQPGDPAAAAGGLPPYSATGTNLQVPENAAQDGTNNGIEQYQHMLEREPVQPDFLPLAPDHEQYLGQLLDHWEKTSSQIERLTCEFQRWDYDPTYCNWRDPRDNRLAAYRIVRGKIQYGAPDKADSQALEIWEFAGTKDNANVEAHYNRNEAPEARERWMCDGKAIHEFDFHNKKLYEVEIPPEMQGAALSQSPLPFLFGAKRTEMQDRFWMRVSTPPGVQDEYWIEAWPKRKEDAVNYQRVEIVIAAVDFLPKSIHIYSRDYDEKSSPISHHFEFADKLVNDRLSGIRDFFGAFIRPSTPIGWERVQLNRMGGPRGVSADASSDPARDPVPETPPIR